MDSSQRSSFGKAGAFARSEEHTSELQSRFDLVCRLLLEKKKKNTIPTTPPHLIPCSPAPHLPSIASTSSPTTSPAPTAATYTASLPTPRLASLPLIDCPT